METYQGVPQRFVIVTDYKNSNMVTSCANEHLAQSWAVLARLNGFKAVVVQTAA